MWPLAIQLDTVLHLFIVKASYYWSLSVHTTETGACVVDQYQFETL